MLRRDTREATLGLLKNGDVLEGRGVRANLKEKHSARVGVCRFCKLLSSEFLVNGCCEKPECRSKLDLEGTNNQEATLEDIQLAREAGLVTPADDPERVIGVARPRSKATHLPRVEDVVPIARARLIKNPNKIQ